MQICFERTNILRRKEGKDVAINLHQKRTLKRTVAKQEYHQLLTVQQKEYSTKQKGSKHKKQL